MAIDTNHKKLIMCIIGGIIFHFGIGAIFPLGTFSIYILSYHIHTENWLTVDYGYFFTPVITLFLTISASIGGHLEAKVGVHKSLTIGTLVAFIGCIVLYFSEYIIFTYISLCIMGIGFGLCLAAPVKNACLYNPHKKGIISSLIASVGHISTALYLLLGEFLINPDAESLEKGKEYYKIKIAKNIKKYYIVILIAVPLSTAIALLFTYQYKEEEQQQEIDTQDETNTERCIDKVSNNSIAQQSTVTNIYSHELSQAFKSKRLWICATLTFLISFIILLQLNTFKTIGTLNEVPVPYLTVTAAFSGIGLVAFGPIWGYISDKVRFNILIVIITAIGVIMGVSLGLTLQYKMDLSFCLLTSLGVICVAGLMNIMNPHIMKVFGIKYLMQLGGIINLSNGLSNVIGSIFAFVVSQVYSEKNQNVGYYILYGVGGVFSLLALMLSFCENDDEFFATHLINSVSKIVTEQPSIANSNDISKIPESNNRTYEEIKE